MSECRRIPGFPCVGECTDEFCERAKFTERSQAEPVSQIEIPDTRDISECCVRCAVDGGHRGKHKYPPGHVNALVADLRGLTDEWVRDAGGNVSAEADEVLAVLDKHAGEQSASQIEIRDVALVQTPLHPSWSVQSARKIGKEVSSDE